MTGTSEVGMVYSYIALLEKQYRGLIITKDYCKKDISKLNDAVISIGKGINRGFGSVKIELKEIDKNNIIRRYERIGKRVVLKTISPIFKLDIKEKGLVTTYDFKIKSNSCCVLSNGYTKVSGFGFYSNTPKVKLNALKESSLLIINGNMNHEEIADIELNGMSYPVQVLI